MPRWLLFPANCYYWFASVMSHKPRRNLRSGHYDHAVRQRRRSDRLRQRHRLRPCLKRLDPKLKSRASRRRKNSYRNGLGELLARTRSARPIRRNETKRRRPRRRRRSIAILHRAEKRLHRKVGRIEEPLIDYPFSEFVEAFHHASTFTRCLGL